MPALTAKPYLRSVRIDPQAELDLDSYPFTMPPCANWASSSRTRT